MINFVLKVICGMLINYGMQINQGLGITIASVQFIVVQTMFLWDYIKNNPSYVPSIMLGMI